MKIFLHGLESSSRGTKATFLRQRFPGLRIPDFQGSLEKRLAALRPLLAGRHQVVLVGSSFGGLMATIYAMENPAGVEMLILLAPALNFPEFSVWPRRRIEIPTWMVIGRDDTVTPPSAVVPVAREIFADLRYVEVEDDHTLAMTFRHLDWENLLSPVGKNVLSPWTPGFRHE